ncbi:MAG: hypothetical protein ACFE95_09730 [Candidatus Hodarchaeota archaeon]
MTEEQFKSKVKDLKKGVNKLIDNRIEKILQSGCVDLNDYEDNYILPKMFIYAVAEEIKFQFKPLLEKHLKEGKNMINFM